MGGEGESESWLSLLRRLTGEHAQKSLTATASCPLCRLIFLLGRSDATISDRGARSSRGAAAGPAPWRGGQHSVGSTGPGPGLPPTAWVLLRPHGHHAGSAQPANPGDFQAIRSINSSCAGVTTLTLQVCSLLLLLSP